MSFPHREHPRALPRPAAPAHSIIASLQGELAGFPAGASDGGLALYRAIADQLPQGAVFVVDTALRYVLAAGASLRDAGFTPDDFEGRLLHEALPAAELERYESDYRSILGGAPMLREHRVNGRDYVSHGTPLRGTDGSIQAALVVSYDISERKRTEDRLRLLDALAHAACTETRAPALEACAAALLGAHFQDVRCLFACAGEGAAHPLVDGAPLAALGPDALASLNAGQPVCIADAGDGAWPGLPASVRALLAVPHLVDGRLADVTLLASAQPRAWRSDEVDLLRDCAGRVWSDAQRLRLMEALREADRQKNRFLAVLAHELRNPLSVARNGVALLKQAQGRVPPERIVGLVEQQFGHMGRLIEDVLDASYISYGQLALRCQRLALAGALAAAVDAARTLADAKGLALTLTMPQAAPDGGPYVHADPTRLAQAIGNVIANAIKYTPAPGAVRVELEYAGERAIVRTLDTGIGMSAATTSRLFELFARGEDGAGHGTGYAGPVGGLGVGMWVTRQLVEAHGGAITAASDGPGAGSVFTIALPLMTSAPG